MWWQLQLLACLSVTVKGAIYRTQGFTLTAVVAAIVLICILEPSFLKSFKTAPSFFQAWFVGQASLAVFGCIASYLVGDIGLTFKHYMGMFFALLSGYLLIS